MAKTHFLRGFYYKTSPLLATDEQKNQNLKPMITRSEAAKLIDEITGATTKIFANVVILVSKRGHLAMGFKSPAECLRKKLKDFSTSYISRLLTGTEIYLKLDPKLTYLHKVSEATFRPLQKVSDDDAKTVWDFVLEQYADKTKRINSRHIKKAMGELGIKNDDNATRQPPVKFRLSDKLQPQVQRYVDKLTKSLIYPNISSKAEYLQFAKLIYLEMLEQCRFEDDHKSNAKQAA